MNSALPQLEETAAKWLVQREPYPVIAADRIDVVLHVLEVAGRTKQKVLVFGSGSGFDEQLTLLRDNVVAITLAPLTARKANDEFSVVLSSGTPFSEVTKQHAMYPGRTLGGFLCGQLSATLHELRRRIWSHVENVLIADGGGKLLTLPGPSASQAKSSCGADALLGSQGRLAILLDVTIKAPLPKDIVVPEDGSSSMNLASAGKAPFTREEIRGIFDPHALFAW